ncbi:MAG: hypothetical protein Q9183_005897 [Haloplaca sp. 2 TL-2023]
MAQAINYASIAPQSGTAAAGAKAVSSNFLSGGHKLKGSKAPTPKASTPVAGASTNPPSQPLRPRTNGPQPLRLPPGKLFFGYEIKPVKKKGEENKENEDDAKPHFQGQGQSLRGGTKRKGNDSETEAKGKGKEEKSGGSGQSSVGGRTLRDTPK